MAHTFIDPTLLTQTSGAPFQAVAGLDKSTLVVEQQFKPFKMTRKEIVGLCLINYYIILMQLSESLVTRKRPFITSVPPHDADNIKHV